MGATNLLDLHRLDRLLFVTSEHAIGKLSATPYGKEQLDYLGVVVGNRLVTLTDRPASIYTAVKAMRAKIPPGLVIDGVVIIGDYESVPSRRIHVISIAAIKALNNSNYEADDDNWRVWTDDLYGDLNADGYADVPVSRIPIVPTVGGILGDRPAPMQQIPAFNGFRSAEFDFADDPYRTYLAKNPAARMPTSPKKRAYRPAGGQNGPGPDDLVSGLDIAANLVYLPLHSSSDRGARFFGELSGMSTTTINLDILNIEKGEWQTRGVVFSGACWGALTATAASFEPMEAWSAKDSIALTFVDRGANAYVGFTALHYVEKDGQSTGSVLHRAFWANIVDRKLPPAKALFEARIQFLADSRKERPDPLIRATTLKTFWSATCLGLGW